MLMKTQKTTFCLSLYVVRFVCVLCMKCCAHFGEKDYFDGSFLNDLFSVLHLMRDVYNSIKY